MSNIRISIALATYNGAAFLPQQLNSYVEQERLPDELVVGDDGSSDETLSIIRQFASQAPFPVRLLDGPSAGGLAANFERVIAACTGDIILLSDQDDVWLPEKIAAVERAMADAPHMLALHHDEWLMDSDSGRRLDRTMAERLHRSASWDHYLFAANCMALRRELLPIVLPIPSQFGFDEWLSIVPEALGARLILDQPLQLWRRHATNASQPAAAEADPPGRWAMAQRYSGQDPRPGWRSECEKLGVLRRRFEEKRKAIDSMLGQGRTGCAVRELNGKMAAIDRRIARLSLPRSRRWASVVAALARGDYRRFSGWQSALKDAIRRP